MIKIDPSTLDVYEMLAQALIQSDQADAVCENAQTILTSAQTIRSAIADDDIQGVVRESQKIFGAWEKIQSLTASKGKNGLSDADLESIEQKAGAIVESTDHTAEIRRKAATVLMGVKMVRSAKATNSPAMVFRESELLVNKCESLLLMLNESHIVRGKKFDAGPRGKRLDALGKAMVGAWREYEKEHGRAPMARQLWHFLPLGGCVQEKDDGVIFWKRSNGKEEKTRFKSFQTRYTALKKNQILKK